MKTYQLTERGYIHEGKTSAQWFADSMRGDGLDEYCLRIAIDLRNADRKARGLTPPSRRPTEFRRGAESMRHALYGMLPEDSDTPWWRVRSEILPRIGIADEESTPSDMDLLNWLEGQIVDVIYLDDGRIIDVKGNSVRAAISERMQIGGEVKL